MWIFTKLFISSIVDLKKTPHNRVHQIIKHLHKKHEITAFCINDWWKGKQMNAPEYSKDFNNFLDEIEIIYMTDRSVSPVLQEVSSFRSIKKMDLKEFNVHFNYNTLVSGHFISKEINSSVYDIADDLPEMIRTSPQIPCFFKSIGYMLGSKMLKDNISCSKKVTYITNSLKENYNLPNSKAVYIPNGVDTELFNVYSPDILESSFNLDGEFIIGYVGVLREWVDLEPVFKAMSLFSPTLNIKFLIVGEEGGLQRNKMLAKDYGVSDKVIFTGSVPYYQVPKYISCMDVCLIPFKKDAVAKNSLPLKLFEYMACKRPVISTRLPGVVDAVGDRIMYASDYKEFYEKIICLYNSDSSRQSMGTEGRDFVVNNYEWSVICEKLNKVLEESAA